MMTKSKAKRIAGMILMGAGLVAFPCGAQIVTNDDSIRVTNQSLYAAYSILNAVTNNASFSVEGGSTTRVSSLFSLGFNAGRTGLLSVMDGSSLISSNFVIGQNGKGYAVCSDSSVECRNQLTVGANARSYGEFRLDASSNFLNANLLIGYNTGATGAYLMGRGSCLYQTNGTLYAWYTIPGLSIGGFGNGFLAATGSTIQTACDQLVAASAGSCGTMILSGVTNLLAMNFRSAMAPRVTGSLYFADATLVRGSRRSIWTTIGWRSYDIAMAVGEWGQTLLDMRDSVLDWAGAMYVGTYSGSVGVASIQASTVSVGSAVFIGYASGSVGSVSMKESHLRQWSNGASCAFLSYTTGGLYVGYSGQGVLAATSSAIDSCAGNFVGFTNMGYGRVYLDASTQTVQRDYRIGVYGLSSGEVYLSRGSILQSTNTHAWISLGFMGDSRGTLRLDDSALNLRSDLTVGGARTNPGGSGLLALTNHARLEVAGSVWVHRAGAVLADQWDTMQFSNRIWLMSGSVFRASAAEGTGSVLRFLAGSSGSNATFDMQGGYFQVGVGKTSEFYNSQAWFSNVTFGSGFILNVFTGAAGYSQNADPRGSSVVCGVDNLVGARVTDPHYELSITNYYAGVVGWFGVSGVVGQATYTTNLDLNAYAYPGNIFTLSNGVLDVSSNLLIVGADQTLQGLGGATFIPQDVLNAGQWILDGPGVRANIAGSMQNYGQLKVAHGAIYSKTGSTVTNNGMLWVTNSAAFSDQDVVNASESNAWFSVLGSSTAVVANTFSMGQAAGFTGIVEIGGGSLLSVTNGTNAFLLVGQAGAGFMTVSNATVTVAGSESIAHEASAYGLMNLYGATNTLRYLHVAAAPGSTGLMQIASGSLLSTSNGAIRVGHAGTLIAKDQSRLRLVDGSMYLSNNANFVLNNASMDCSGSTTGFLANLTLATNASLRFSDQNGRFGQHALLWGFRPSIFGVATISVARCNWTVATNLYLGTNSGAAVVLEMTDCTGILDRLTLNVAADTTSRVTISQSKVLVNTWLEMGNARSRSELTLSNSYLSSVFNQGIGNLSYSKLTLINSTNISGWSCTVGNNPGCTGEVHVLDNSLLSWPDGNGNILGGAGGYGYLLVSNATFDCSGLTMQGFWCSGNARLDSWQGLCTFSRFVKCPGGPGTARINLNEGSRFLQSGPDSYLAIGAGGSTLCGPGYGYLRATGSLIQVAGTQYIATASLGRGELQLTRSTNQARVIEVGVFGTGYVYAAESVIAQTSSVHGFSLGSMPLSRGMVDLSDASLDVAGWLSLGGRQSVTGGYGRILVTNNSVLTVAGTTWVHPLGRYEAYNWERISHASPLLFSSGSVFLARSSVGTNSPLIFAQGLMSTSMTFHMEGGLFQNDAAAPCLFASPVSATFTNVTFATGVLNVVQGAIGNTTNADPLGSGQWEIPGIAGASFENPLYLAVGTNIQGGQVGWWSSNAQGVAQYSQDLNLSDYRYPGDVFILSNCVLSVPSHVLTIGAGQTLVGVGGGGGAIFSNGVVGNAGVWLLDGADVRAEVAGGVGNAGVVGVYNGARFSKTVAAVTNDGVIEVTNHAAFYDEDVLNGVASDAGFYVSEQSTAVVAHVFSLGVNPGVRGELAVFSGSELAQTNPAYFSAVGQSGVGWAGVSNSVWSVAGTQYVGMAEGSTGLCELVDAVMNVGKQTIIGHCGDGMLRAQGSAIRSGDQELIGNMPGSTGRLELVSSTNQVNGLVMAASTGAVGEFLMADSHFEQNNLSNAVSFRLGLGGRANFTASNSTLAIVQSMNIGGIFGSTAPGYAVMTMNASTCHLGRFLQVGSGVNSTGRLGLVNSALLQTNYWGEDAIQVSQDGRGTLTATNSYVFSVGGWQVPRDILATGWVYAANSTFEVGEMSVGYQTNCSGFITLTDSYLSNTGAFTVSRIGKSYVHATRSTVLAAREYVGRLDGSEGYMFLSGSTNIVQALSVASSGNSKGYLALDQDSRLEVSGGPFVVGGGGAITNRGASVVHMQNGQMMLSNTASFVVDGASLEFSGSTTNLSWNRISLRNGTGVRFLEGDHSVSGFPGSCSGDVDVESVTNNWWIVGDTVFASTAGGMALRLIGSKAIIQGSADVGRSSSTGDVFITEAGSLGVEGPLTIAEGSRMAVSNGGISVLGWWVNHGDLSLGEGSSHGADRMEVHGRLEMINSAWRGDQSLFISPSASLVCVESGLINLGGDFEWMATNSARIDLTNAMVRFDNGPGTNHTLWVPGKDRSKIWMATESNCVLGALAVAIDNGLTLADVDGDGTGAVYVVGAVSFEGGVEQITHAVTGNGLNIYYRPELPGNEYLQTNRYAWSDNAIGRGGGELIPLGNATPGQVELHSPVNCPDDGGLGLDGDNLPAYGRTLNPRAKLIWRVPLDTDGDALHFIVCLDDADGTTPRVSSVTNQTGFRYWDGSMWQIFPSEGLPGTDASVRVSYEPPDSWALSTTALYWRVCAMDGIVTGEFSSTWRFQCGGRLWTDVELTAGQSPIRAVHIDELREEANYLRVCRTLPTNAWTDADIVPRQTRIRDDHIVELRNALEAVTNVTGSVLPIWSDPVIVPYQTPIREKHIEEMRDALQNL